MGTEMAMEVDNLVQEALASFWYLTYISYSRTSHTIRLMISADPYCEPTRSAIVRPSAQFRFKQCDTGSVRPIIGCESFGQTKVLGQQATGGKGEDAVGHSD